MSEHYNDSLEHIYDELLLVDLRLHIEVIKNEAEDKHGYEFAKYKGLFVSKDEIDDIIDGGPIGQEWTKKAGYSNEEIGRLSQSLKKIHEGIEQKVETSVDMGIELNLFTLAKLFELSSLEIEILAICLAPEIDLKYRKVFSFLQNDVTKKHPSVDLILNLVSESFEEKIDTREYFSHLSPLFKYNLIEFLDNDFDSAMPLLSQELRVNSRISGFLLGSQFIEEKIAAISHLYYTNQELDQLVLPEGIIDQLINFIDFYNDQKEENISQRYVFSFHGSYGADKREIAAVLCREIGIPLIVVDLEACMNLNTPFDDVISLAIRESMLVPAALYLRNCDHIFSEDEQVFFLRRSLLEALNNDSWLTFIDSQYPVNIHGEFASHTFIEINLPVPAYAKRRDLWEQNLDNHPTVENLDLKELSGKFNLSSAQIRDAVATAANQAFWRSPREPQLSIEDIYEACHIHSNQRLKKLAQKIKPRYEWEDMILPDENQTQLKEIITNVRFKHIVYNEWGFDRKLSSGKGFSALFYGPPGTGKTMAADIIAKKLNLDMYKIDLSTVVSKYIGETEKNLSKIFEEAETSNAILFFDEADALFGKRTEVKDSHDRYANIEVGYLLQRIDEYDGVVILASNIKKNMDDAFERRLQFSINFPFPEEESRLRIWKGIFPKEMPLAEDMDFDFVAKKLKISGGNIKNCALAAAFYAADDGDGNLVSFKHLIKGCKREFQKIGRSWEFRDIIKERDAEKEKEAEKKAGGKAEEKESISN
ncbi:MAG: ATP-binding protein [bacterium]|nr:ATP-binding protein [bacterium]